MRFHVAKQGREGIVVCLLLRYELEKERAMEKKGESSEAPKKS